MEIRTDGEMVPDKSQQSYAANLISELENRAGRHVADAGHGQVVWRSFGVGAPLILVHGGHGSWLHWVRNIEAFAKHFTVWVPDLPGYGESDVPTNADLAAIVGPTIATMDALVGATTKVAIVGFSFGGLVAAHMAALRGHVEKLALLGPAGHGGPRRERGKLIGWQAAQAANDTEGVRAAMHHNLAMHMLHDPARIDALALEVHTRSCFRTRFRSKELSRSDDLVKILEHQSASVLAVWGEHDVTGEPSVLTRTLSDQLPQCTAQVIKGAGHWVQYECADEINALLTTWLNKGMGI